MFDDAVLVIYYKDGNTIVKNIESLTIGNQSVRKRFCFFIKFNTLRFCSRLKSISSQFFSPFLSKPVLKFDLF